MYASKVSAKRGCLPYTDFRYGFRLRCRLLRISLLGSDDTTSVSRPHRGKGQRATPSLGLVSPVWDLEGPNDAARGFFPHLVFGAGAMKIHFPYVLGKCQVP